MPANVATCETTIPLDDPGIDLMLRVQRDDPGAFDDLITLYWSRIFGRFFQQFRDRQEAEDLAQDVFLRLFRNRKRYRPQARFSTWLFHIARNVTRNALRTHRRKPMTSIAFMDLADEPCFGHAHDKMEPPSRPMERAEVSGIVRNAVASLPRRQRTAIELQCLDHSYSEIALKLEMTAKAAKSLLYRARNELRETLSPVVDVFA